MCVVNKQFELLEVCVDLKYNESSLTFTGVCCVVMASSLVCQ